MSVTLVDAWLFPVVSGASDDPATTALLAPRERERVARLGPRTDRDLATCARVAARIEVGRRMGVGAADVPLDAGDGPPAIRGIDTRVSWSHSGRWIALALAAGRAVGIDIEQVPHRLDLAALAELDVWSLDDFVALEAASKATACRYDGAWPPGVAVRRLSAPSGYVAAIAAAVAERGDDWTVELHMKSPLHMIEGSLTPC